MARTKQIARRMPPSNNRSASGHQLAVTNPSRNQIPTKARKATPASGKTPKRRDRVLREIRTLQKGTDLLIPKRPFQTLCREIAQNTKTDIRFQKQFFEALQVAAESYITGILSAAYLIAISAKRVTLFPKDIRLLIQLHEMLDCKK